VGAEQFAWKIIHVEGIHTQTWLNLISAGSATRNSSDIVDTLRPFVERSIRRNSGTRSRILELASGTGEHLRAYAKEWEQVEWVGSERDAR
jgi:hypothetical protein